MQLIGDSVPNSIISDVGAVLTTLADDDGIHADRTAIVGFCFGGRGRHSRRLRRFLSPRRWSSTDQVSLAALTLWWTGPRRSAARVLLLVGDADPTILLLEDLAAIEAAAGQSSAELRSVVFAGAGHAFHCDARPDQYVADAARQAWQDATEFLAQTIKRRK